MTLELTDAQARLKDACAALLVQDAHLLQVDANERSITHKLAEHLQRQYPEWDVDCEYNRAGDVPKRLMGAVKTVHTDDTEGKTVYPDIIVHRRGTVENLLVIEAKKTTTALGSADIEKLKAYKSEHGYQYAFAVVFPVGVDASAAGAAPNIREVTE